jgi:hypothetical protein
MSISYTFYYDIEIDWMFPYFSSFKGKSTLRVVPYLYKRIMQIRSVMKKMDFNPILPPYPRGGIWWHAKYPDGKMFTYIERLNVVYYTLLDFLIEIIDLYRQKKVGIVALNSTWIK